MGVFEMEVMAAINSIQSLHIRMANNLILLIPISSWEIAQSALPPQKNL